MKLLIDSREQLPLEFNHPYITSVKVIKLDVGDYGVEFEDGYRPGVFFERKSIADLFGTLTKGYTRFKKEIIRAQDAGVEVIIAIEGNISKVDKGYKYSRVAGEQINRQLMTLWLKHGVGVIWLKDREEMSYFITRFYLSMGREYVRRSRGNKK